ncbi:hypothetical protein [Streptomyces sp. NPDC056670]|uniref:hypothetical protein n=1 Tax=Streptomyces sp. NPDC056670 TaxID=3345904 RepID=UPI0036A3520E
MAFLVLTAGLILSGCTSDSSRKWSVPLEGLSIQDRVVTTTPKIRGCEAARLTARENDSTISLTLRIRTNHRSGEYCFYSLVRTDVSTTLRQPVGDRSIMDTYNKTWLR